MTFLIAALFLTTACMAAPTEPKKVLPVTQVEQNIKDKKFKINEKEEDCDKKAEKPVEIIPETISLGGGTAGCTLPE